MNQRYTFSRLQDLERIEAGRVPARIGPPQIVASGPPADDRDLDLAGILHALLRRKRWIIGTALLSFSVSVLVCLLMKPQYIATSRLQLLNQDMGRLSLGDSQTNSGLEGLDSYSTLQTFVTVLKSDKLGMQVIYELHLMDKPQFQYAPHLKTALAEKRLSEPFEHSAVKRTVALTRFESNLNVEIVPGTRMLAISFTDADPELAAAIVNRLVSDFVEYNYRVQYDSTQKGMALLSQQLVGLKQEVDKSEARAVALQKKSGIFGTDEQHNIIVDRLDQLNSQVVAAQQNRISKELIFKLAQNGSPELVANLVGATASSGPSTGSAFPASSPQSAPLITMLRKEEADLDLEYAEAASKYGPAYPKMVEISQRRAAVRASIQAELRRVLDRSRSEFQLARAQEEAARKVFAEQQAISGKMNDQLIDYMSAKSEADDSRQLYDHLLQKLNEAGVLVGLRSSGLHILDPAEVPGSPARPRIRQYLAVGAVGGMILGLLLAFIAEAMDRSTRTPEEIESRIRHPVLGVIPVSGGPSRVRSLPSNGSMGPERHSSTALLPDVIVSEAFLSLRSRLLLSSTHMRAKVLLVASAMQGDGKSFTSLNLARALTQNQANVLLVDADLRQAKLSHTINDNSGYGLYGALSGMPLRNCYRKVEFISGLTFLPAGTMRGDSPAEILGSQAIRDLLQIWRRDFTHIVIDTPPLLAVADAVVLSSLADGVILLARYGVTDIRLLLRAARLLDDVNAKCLGVLINAMDNRSAEYQRYTGAGDYVSDYLDPQLASVAATHRKEDLA